MASVSADLRILPTTLDCLNLIFSLYVTRRLADCSLPSIQKPRRFSSSRQQEKEKLGLVCLFQCR
jgi:hypothetical protein